MRKLLISVVSAALLTASAAPALATHNNDVTPPGLPHEGEYLNCEAVPGIQESARHTLKGVFHQNACSGGIEI